MSKTKAVKLAKPPPARRAGGLVTAIADQPQLFAAAIGTLGIGAVTRRADLVRGGARMLAAQLVVAALRDVVGARLDHAAGREVDGRGQPIAATRPAGGSHHLTDAVVVGVVGWVAEAVVGAVFDRVEPAVERALASRSKG